MANASFDLPGEDCGIYFFDRLEKICDLAAEDRREKELTAER